MKGYTAVKSGQQKNPVKERLPGWTATAKERYRAIEDRSCPAHRHLDSRDGKLRKEGRTAGTAGLQPCASIVTVWMASDVTAPREDGNSATGASISKSEGSLCVSAAHVPLSAFTQELRRRGN
ncbi:hypothetical protein T4E_7001 [Trichinella pseudospiralis]|uniref:Uncharacterized protein n=1 Tax=Trichinella pseudospiralis TaxID=6337 RepID=A0A0V0XZ19_TRIPS|nr:hypothetical protein T4E_7001 [Trichinella pseudospiralis]